MEKESIIKSNQEQAIASWINYLNQIRLDCLLKTLHFEQENLDTAMHTINETLETINKEIVNNGLGRGGSKGMHGFIAEVAECGIGNAKKQIEGKCPIYEWINDNGPEDLRRGGLLIQQKFVNAGNHLSLQAILKHIEHYPDFVKNGGIYQIPSDHYEKIQYLLSISKDEANKLATSTGEFSMKQWQEVHDFFEKEIVNIDSIEPSLLDYKSVQKNAYEATLNAEKRKLQERNNERKEQAYQKGKPSFEQGAKATAVAAIAEGSIAFCLGIVKKVKEGKEIKDFDEDDWKEILGDTRISTVKGGVRGASIYLLTNYTETPASVANAIITASFGMAEQVHLYRIGTIDEKTLLLNSEVVCIDAAVSALSSLVGEALIPIPVLGAVVGNTVGTMLYGFAKDSFTAHEQELVKEYVTEINKLDEELQNQYGSFLENLSQNMNLFISILERAFSPDVRIAFDGSVELAIEMGVKTEEILDSKEKITRYFLE